jgi:mRNA interferase RelE/StbE
MKKQKESLVWVVDYSDTAIKQLSKLDRPIKNRILHWLEKHINSNNADPYSSGSQLQGNKHEFWRYRVGDYRIICQVQNDKMIVLVVTVGHRRHVYNL